MQDKTFYVHYEQKYKQDTYCYADEVKATSYEEAERIVEERYGNDPLTPLTITSIRSVTPAVEITSIESSSL